MKWVRLFWRDETTLLPMARTRYESKIKFNGSRRKLSDRQKNKRKNPVLKQDTILQEDMFEVAENLWDILIEN